MDAEEGRQGLFTKMVLTVGGGTFQVEGDALALDATLLELIGQWFRRLPPGPDQTASVLAAAIQALKEVLVSKADDILGQVGDVNTTATGMAGSMGDISTSLDNIAGDIARLQAQAVGGLTPDETQGISNGLGSAVDNLKAVAAKFKTMAEDIKTLAAVVPEDGASESPSPSPSVGGDPTV